MLANQLLQEVQRHVDVRRGQAANRLPRHLPGTHHPLRVDGEVHVGLRQERTQELELVFDGRPARLDVDDELEAVIAGLGIALRSTWDVGAELKSGKLVQVLPQYESSRNVALSAVYPSRQFLPAKVRLFIDYLAELYGPVPYWER